MSQLKTSPPFRFEFDDPVYYNRGFDVTLDLSNGLIGSWTIYGYFEGGKGWVTERGNFNALTKDQSQTIADPNSFPPATSLSDLVERLKH